MRPKVNSNPFEISNRGGATRGAAEALAFLPPTFLLSNHFLFFEKKCLHANKRDQDKPLSRKKVYSKHKSIQSLRMPKFRVLKIKNAKCVWKIEIIRYK